MLRTMIATVVTVLAIGGGVLAGAGMASAAVDGDHTDVATTQDWSGYPSCSGICW